MSIKSRLTRSLAAGLGVAALLGGQFAPLVRACGPEPTLVLFQPTSLPDFPLKPYTSGQLGVLRDYSRGFLTIAYRQLRGVPLNADEQEAVTDLMRERLAPYLSTTGEGATGKNAWTTARKTVPGAAKIDYFFDYRDISSLPERSGKENYGSFYNCADDAYATATKTLADRQTRYGKDSQQVKDWLTAQDMVFANCSDKTNTIDAATGGDALVMADRAYQSAAADFYAGRYPEARTKFTAIAQNSSSPWTKTAAYVVGRVMLRQAVFGDSAQRIARYRETLSYLDRLVKTTTDSDLQTSARKMQAFIRFRLDPAAAHAQLTQALLRPNSQDTIRQDLTDYIFLMDRILDGDFPFDDEEVRRRYTSLRDEVRRVDMTDWIATMKDTGPSAFDHAKSKWNETKQDTWLVAALTLAAANSDTSALTAAAERVSPTSPAYFSVNYQLNRLLIANGKADAARQRLDQMLGTGPQVKPAPPSVNVTLAGQTVSRGTYNDFIAQRFPLATNLDDFLRDAPRYPVSYISQLGLDPTEKIEPAVIEGLSTPLFDTDAADMINSRLPLATLQMAATNPKVPSNLHRELVQAAWVRAVLLGNHQIGRQLAPELSKVIPDTKPFVTAYLASKSDADAKWNALYLMLKVPGIEPYVNAQVGRETPVLEIDSLRDNWWCAPYDSYLSLTPPAKKPDDDSYQPEFKLIKYPAFVTKAQQSTAQKELAALKALNNAPNYLAAQAVAWAAAAPQDSRVPEALHLAVKSTRYGCVDKTVAPYSKAAYDTLKKQYPRSTWAAQTKYWFKGEN